MKLLRQFLIIISICFIGELVHKVLKVPVPGNVIGMILLFVCLLSGIIKVETISDITRFLMDHLAFFFIPAGVGILAYMGLMKANLIPLVLISVITTALVMVVTGHAVQLMKRGRKV